MNFNPWSQYSAPAIQPQTSPAPYAIQSGFVSVQSEQEARMYPVALDNSITFMDECAPYMYVKTMGRSRFDPPTFRGGAYDDGGSYGPGPGRGSGANRDSMGRYASEYRGGSYDGRGSYENRGSYNGGESYDDGMNSSYRGR